MTKVTQKWVTVHRNHYLCGYRMDEWLSGKRFILG